MYPGMKARRRRNAGIELSCRETVNYFSRAVKAVIQDLKRSCVAALLLLYEVL